MFSRKAVDMKSIIITSTAHWTFAMKETLIKIALINLMLCLMFWFITRPALAGDYMVELFQEHYNEKMITGTGMRNK